MRSSFLLDDVTILLKDVTDIMNAETLEVREQHIKEGKKAYEFIPQEAKPTDEAVRFFQKGLNVSLLDTALMIKSVAEKIFKEKGENVVLISLARGGIIGGILIKRYLEGKYQIKVPHYSLTLIGTKGIDTKALEFVLSKHEAKNIQFVDGWTGKGAMNRALAKALKDYEGISTELAVLCDPANTTKMCGTHEDLLIASACLNAPLAGLLSRSVYFKDSFFGAIFFEELLDYDQTYHFIDEVQKKFDYEGTDNNEEPIGTSGIIEVQKIAQDFGINDVHFIKPGISETIRGFIRKKPDVILVSNQSNKYTEFIKEMTKDSGVLIKEYPLINYTACGIYTDSNSDIL